jgi:hypothetical protein
VLMEDSATYGNGVEDNGYFDGKVLMLGGSSTVCKGKSSKSKSKTWMQLINVLNQGRSLKPDYDIVDGCESGQDAKGYFKIILEFINSSSGGLITKKSEMLIQDCYDNLKKEVSSRLEEDSTG